MDTNILKIISVIVIAMYIFYKTRDKSILIAIVIVAHTYMAMQHREFIDSLISLDSPQLKGIILLGMLFAPILLAFAYYLYQFAIGKDKKSDKKVDISVVFELTRDNIIFWIAFIISVLFFHFIL